ncbi:adenosine deaminase CECR1 [Elysia marginata]|uniref:adenosine deaminase n=1 Tax=Elysia marginata TaxID=1093978 RepID=A0AAV4FT97_9GAST|nr:adenosine deaminase CECR1 [Elysia marginata]
MDEQVLRDPSLKTRPIVAMVTASTVVVVAAMVTTVVILNLDSTTVTEATPLPFSGRGYNREEYMAARQSLLAKDQGRALGAKLKLNAKEQILNGILLKEKKEIMEKARVDRVLYTPALSFFKSKDWMEKTDTFKIIRKMPKGAALHLHEPAIASMDWLVKNLTYRPNIYMCTNKQGLILINTFQSPPSDPDCPWKLVSAERAKAQSIEEFDHTMRRSLSFIKTDPLTSFNGTNGAWDRFNLWFQQYTEIDGTVHNATFGAEMYKNATEMFVATHPDFFGAKIIMSGLRFKSKKDIADEVKTAMALRRKFPDFVLGYDLVAQEDPLNPLLFYLDGLLFPTQQSLDNAVPYFFHAGETKWEGTDVDENLIDALLLNTTRIGHGYALAKHPELADLVKERGIAVEVNPISNQVLGLVEDLRNHAMVPLLADDFPLVISSDDPATWEALPLTHDFFVAFMDLSSQDMGLGFLKQLAINSIRYSALSKNEKESLMSMWQIKWDKFVEDAVDQFSSG